MDKNSCQAHGRSLRWYEWLVLLLLFGLAGGVRAATVYKCIDAQGGIAYQAQPCAAAQHESTVVIAPAPRYAPSPQYATQARGGRTAPRAQYPPRRARAQNLSFECRASDGQEFYRHGGCPHSVAADPADSARGHGRSGGSSVSVSARAIPREQACAQMHRAGAIGRAGHQHDETVSTYERDLGHDPCA